MNALLRLRRRALQTFFRWLYRRGAWSYDLVAAAVSLGRWQDWVLSTLPWLTGPRVLELGFGPGYLQAALCTRGVQVYGLDASAYMARLARRRVQSRCRGASALRLVLAQAQAAPFAAAAFDQIVATFPSEYIFQVQSLRELRRLLRPGGELLILPMAWVTGSAPWERAAAALFRVTGQSGPRRADWQAFFAPPFRQAGFSLQTRLLRLPSGSALLLHAARV